MNSFSEKTKGMMAHLEGVKRHIEKIEHENALLKTEFRKAYVQAERLPREDVSGQ